MKYSNVSGLPSLPDGLRWKITWSFNSPYLKLQKKTLFFWWTVEEGYIINWHTGDFDTRARREADDILKRTKARNKILSGKSGVVQPDPPVQQPGEYDE